MHCTCQELQTSHWNRVGTRDFRKPIDALVWCVGQYCALMKRLASSLKHTVCTRLDLYIRASFPPPMMKQRNQRRAQYLDPFRYFYYMFLERLCSTL